MTQSCTATVKYQDEKLFPRGNKPPEVSFIPFYCASFKNKVWQGLLA